MKIFDHTGRVAQTQQYDEYKLGIEDVLEMQNKSEGKGIPLTKTQLQTVQILELHRTKVFALQLAEGLIKRITDLEKTVAQLEAKTNV